MPILQSEKREAFAQALARGVKTDKAYRDAGYAPSRNASPVSKEKNIVARVTEIRLELAGSGSPDMAPLIDEAVRAFQACLKLNSAAGMVAARGFLVEIARLKQLARREAIQSVAVDQRLSTEAWAKANGVAG